MIRVTIMVWDENSKGEPTFKEWEDVIYGWEAQPLARELANLNYNGSCKIFDENSRVIGSAGFE